MPERRLRVAEGLAAAFLAGDWEPLSMTRRGQRAVGQRRVWVRDLALAARHAYPVAPRDSPRELAQFLAVCSPLSKAFSPASRPSEPPPTVERWYLTETAMGVRRWPVAELHTVRDLQDLFGLATSELMWFADPKLLERTVPDERLRHYRYRWAHKRSGGVRLIEEPKPLLKHFQRVILREILGHVPLDPSAHGFRPGHSALTYAGEHVRRRVVVHLDLHDFFVSIPPGRVYGIFRQCGYPERVAHLLTALVTNAVPSSVWASAPRPADPRLLPAHRAVGRHLSRQHLPQGAPTSPALANLAAFRLDRRLAGLAAATGMSYTRYADDLAFSSTVHRRPSEVSRVVDVVTRIAAAEGFRVNPTKTSVRRAGQRQRLAGVVVNDRPNVDRREYDRLKATVHNAVRYGPSSQNLDGHPRYREHLLGRISWVNHLNRRRGERLLAAFATIDWSER